MSITITGKNVRSKAQFDAIVVGSGISGLTTAAILAKKGRNVMVLEKKARPGGALKRFSRQGIEFDVGFHYTAGLGPGEVLFGLWNYLGVLPHLKVIKFPDQGHDSYSIQGTDQRIRAYYSETLFREELCSRFPRETAAIDRYLETIRGICAQIPFYNPEQALSPFLQTYPFSSAERLGPFLQSLTSDESLQAVLSAPSFLYGVPPAETTVTVHATIAYPLLQGAYGIDRGGQRIVDAYRKVLAASGATIARNEEVTGIDCVGDCVRGVRTTKDYHTAREVVFTGHPGGLLGLVPPDTFRPAYRHRLQALKNTASMLVVFGAMPKTPASLADLDWANYYSLRPGLSSFAVDPQRPENTSFLLTAPGRRDRGVRHMKNNAGVILMRPAGWDEVARYSASRKTTRPRAYRDWKKQAAQRLIDQAARHFKVDKPVEPLTVGTPLTFQNELSAPEGAAYGVQCRYGQMNPSARTKMPGLWLAGQSTLMPGVVGASLSGFVAAGQMTGLESLWDELNQCR